MSEISIPSRAAEITSLQSLERSIAEGMAKRIESGEYTAEELHTVTNLTLPASSGTLKASPEMLERLRRAAQLWDVQLKSKDFTSHRPVIGPLIVGVKKALFPIIHFFLNDTLRQQRDFNAAVLRSLVEITREMNEKNSENT